MGLVSSETSNNRIRSPALQARRYLSRGAISRREQAQHSGGAVHNHPTQAFSITFGSCESASMNSVESANSRGNRGVADCYHGAVGRITIDGASAEVLPV
jgi:hypothetical protein